jgi:general stress protein YciG
MAKRKNPAAVALGRRGGKKRAKKLTPEERSESARKAGQASAAVRWGKKAQ